MKLLTREGRQKSRGQAMAEFALAIPLFMLVTLGIAEGSYYVAATTIVNHATHEGARVGILDKTGTRANIRARVQEAAAPIVTLDNADIKLKLNGNNCSNECYQGRKTGETLVVTTDYTHIPLLGYVLPGLEIVSNASAEMLVEGL